MADPRHIRHRIERTRNKHSRAVIRDDTIIIRLARNLSKAEEEEHIEDLLRRMSRHVEAEQQCTKIDPFQSILDGGQSVTVTLASGKKHSFKLYPGKKTKIERTSRGWRITIGPNVRRKTLHRLLWRVISDSELPYIKRIVEQINEQTYGIKVADVRLRFATSQSLC